MTTQEKIDFVKTQLPKYNMVQHSFLNILFKNSSEFKIKKLHQEFHLTKVKSELAIKIHSIILELIPDALRIAPVTLLKRLESL